MKISNKNYIELRQVGKFLQVFDDDSIIVSYLTNYKIVNSKVGFPSISLNKVISLLEDNHINYVLKGTNNDYEKDYKKNNNYNKILVKAKEVIKLRNRCNEIKPSIEKLSNEKLEKIVNYINEVINE